MPAMSYFQAEIPTYVSDFFREKKWYLPTHNTTPSDRMKAFFLPFHCILIIGASFGMISLAEHLPCHQGSIWFLSSLSSMTSAVPQKTLNYITQPKISVLFLPPQKINLVWDPLWYSKIKTKLDVIKCFEENFVYWVILWNSVPNLQFKT